MDWEFGVSRCKLLYKEWINKVLLYSTGNYIQYSLIKHNGKEYKKEHIRMYVFCCTAEISNTVNQLYFKKKKTYFYLFILFSLLNFRALYLPRNI